MVAGWSGAYGYGVDMQARQMAESASRAATARGCRMGSARVDVLVALGGSRDVPVVWRAPIVVPYEVEPVAGPGLVGQSVLVVKSQSPDGCVITVSASGLAIAVGAVVLAHAIF